MKINAKTFVIVAVVAAVVFLIWKKRKESVDTGTASGSGPVPGSLDYILANVPFNNAEIRKIKAYNAAVNASTTLKESMREKALAKGNTFDEQVVLDAIWLLYHPKDSWIAGPDGSTTYGWKLQQKVVNLK